VPSKVLAATQPRPSSTNTREGLLRVFRDDPFKLMALACLIWECVLLAIVVRSKETTWYVALSGVLPLLLIIIGVFFGRQSSIDKIHAFDLSKEQRNKKNLEL
jgi:hypothetical protein